MRRRARAGIPAVCVIVSALLCSGCGGGGTAPAPDALALYFPAREFQDEAGSGALKTEAAQVPPGSDAALTARALMEELLDGPADERLQSPFPSGTRLLSLELDGSRAAVDLSTEYGTLSGVALTLADYAVTLTLTQIPEISVVQVTVQGQELAYRDRQSFTARDVLLEPEGDVVGTVDALLYFPGTDGALTEEARTLPLYEGDTQVEAVLTALESGPDSRDLSPAFPEGFRVRAVWQEGELCYVNLSSALMDTMHDAARLPAALRALDLSLCSLENVRAVRYLVDGEFVPDYGGASLTEPYQAAEESAETP